MKWEFEDYLKVVEMSYQKMSQKEIAKIYGLSSGRIGQVLYRGYMQLKRKNRTLIADALISLQVKKNNLIEFGNKYDFTKNNCLRFLRKFINYIHDMMIDHGTSYHKLESDSRTNYAGRFNG